MYVQPTIREAARARRVFVLSACALLTAGCVPGRIGTAVIVVSLRTDFAPAEEFAHVRVEVTTNEGRRVSRDEVAADPAGGYHEGVAILESAIPPGPYLIEVTLVGRAGGHTARRRVAVEAIGPEPQAVTVLITRGSTCDASACAEGQTCGASGCVDVRCTPESPESCPPPECTSLADCPAGSACASPACASGTCLYGARVDACGDGEWCEVTEGCLPRLTPVGDVGAPCNADAECASGPCVDTGDGARACTSECDAAADCMSGWTCGAVEGAAGDACVCTAAGPEVCNAIDDDCDGYVDEDVCAADVGTPCADDDVCAHRVCVDTGGDGGACTMPCRVSGDCMPGWTCGVPVGRTERVCRCTASGEVCNGEDDDCDGSVDERIPCAGEGRVCTMEVCNLADDDCDGYCDDGTTCRRPVHRAYHPTAMRHLYSISLIEITSRPSLMFEAQDYFQVYLASQPGLLPLYRCYWPDERSHFLTKRADCEGADVGGVMGYVAAARVCGSVPLYELRSRVAREDYVYTTSGPERQDMLEDGEWSDWGIIGYVWHSDWTCTDPAEEDCSNGRDDDCDGRIDCDDANDCCSSGECQGVRTAAAYRVRCCRRGWTNIARSEAHCGGCNTRCQGDFQCIRDREGSGHCNCTAADPDCPRGQACRELIAPNDGLLHHRCSCSDDEQCANTFTCRGLGEMSGTHNICHPTL